MNNKAKEVNAAALAGVMLMLTFRLSWFKKNQKHKSFTATYMQDGRTGF